MQEKFKTAKTNLWNLFPQFTDTSSRHFTPSTPLPSLTPFSSHPFPLSVPSAYLFPFLFLSSVKRSEAVNSPVGPGDPSYQRSYKLKIALLLKASWRVFYGANC